MAHFWGSHRKCCVTHLKVSRGVIEKRNMNGGQKKSICSAELHWKIGESGSWCRMARPGAADHGVGHRHPGVSLGWRGFHCFPLSSMNPWCREGKWRDQEETGGRRCIRRGGCVWGRQARKHWEMSVEWLCFARGTKVSHLPPKLPPQYLFHWFKPLVFPLQLTFPFYLF